jgi:sugar lactone lactonase YvrE
MNDAKWVIEAQGGSHYIRGKSQCMNRLLLFFFTASTFFTVNAQTQNLQYFYTEAKNGYAAGDYKKYYEMLVEAHKLHPYHETVLYHLGIASALNNKPEEALTYLRQAIQIKADYDLTIEDLKSLRGKPEFEKLKALQIERQKPVIHSDTAFVIKNKTLHVESIAAGEAKNVFYVGGVHKRNIVRVDEKGETKDFAIPAQDGLASVFAIKVNAAKKILWACSSPRPEMENYDSTMTSCVYKYDLKTGKLLAKYSPEEKMEFVFGDIVLDSHGKVFISDSQNNVIFTVNEATGKLEKYFASEEVWSLQGITFSTDGRHLFIADYIKGVYRLDIKDKTLKLLGKEFDLSIKSIDGLTFYNNNLIAIQNGIYPMRVTVYQLDAAKEKLVSYKIIDTAHPAFNEPTMGCLVNDTFYYVANSLWSGYTKQHQLKPEDQLQNVVILKVDLKKMK